jgi:hypothetical protein
VNLRGIAENAYPGIGAILIANLYHPVHHLGEVRIQRRLSVACKGEDIRGDTLLLQLLQLAYKGCFHFIGRGQGIMGATLTVQTALAIYAVEAAELAALGQ